MRTGAPRQWNGRGSWGCSDHRRDRAARTTAQRGGPHGGCSLDPVEVDSSGGPRQCAHGRTLWAEAVRDPGARGPERDAARRLPRAPGARGSWRDRAGGRAARPGGAAWGPGRDRGPRARIARGTSLVTLTLTPWAREVATRVISRIG